MSENRFEKTLTAITDTVGDAVTGIPAPIRKSFINVFNRLCTASVEYPAALIENAIAERRAESQGRVQLINASAQQIASQIQMDPEYARLAAKKFGQKILRERVNIDQIAHIAADELRSLPPVDTSAQGTAESPPVSDDWLNVFENEAAQISTEYMQRLFGRILAGEIRSPSSFSKKTIKLIAQLDSQSAQLFKTLCSLSSSLKVPGLAGGIIDARVISLGANAAQNSLSPYGLSFDGLNALQEYDLIIPEYNSFMDYRMSILQNGNVGLAFSYQNARWALVEKTVTADAWSRQYPVHGVAFSRCGKELLSIVDITPNESYTAALKKYFESSGMIMSQFESA